MLRIRPGTASFLELSYIFCLLFSHYKYQFCGSELIFQIRIRINNLDPDPTLSLYRKLSPEAKKVINIYKFVYVGSVTLKGQSNEIFDLQIFSSFEPTWAIDQWPNGFKYFRFWLRFRRVIRIFMNLPEV